MTESHTVRGQVFTPALAHWEPLVESWWELLDRFIAKHHDLPYWHSEETNTALFAAAAWRLPDWTALTEYPKRKTSGMGWGKVDLRFSSPDAEREIVECKHHWLSSPTAISEVETALARAVADARCVPGTDRGVGLLWCCPRFPVRDTTDVTGLLLQTVLPLGADITAWYFPAEAATIRSSRNDKWFPGVVLLASVLPVSEATGKQPISPVV